MTNTAPPPVFLAKNRPVSKKAQLQNQKDRFLTQQRLLGFDSTRCQARVVLNEIFGDSLTGAKMLTLAEICCFKLNLYLDREARRRKSVLLKWFEENLAVIKEFLTNHIVIATEENQLLGNPRTIAKLKQYEQEEARNTTTQ